MRHSYRQIVVIQMIGTRRCALYRAVSPFVHNLWYLDGSVVAPPRGLQFLGSATRECCGPNQKSVGAFEVLAFSGINADDFTFINEGWHLDNDAGFEGGGLGHVGC